jgi:TetR/AcrR family transcriptional regulator
MPRSKEQNEVIRDRRRNKILDKSLMLFSVYGFDSISVDDITEATNCSHGLFYHYFLSKEDVFNALIKLKEKQYRNYLFPKEAALTAGGAKGLKIICDYCERTIEADERVLYFARLSTTRHYNVSNYNETLLGEDLYPYLISLIRQGQGEGNVRPGDPDEIASEFVDFCNGAIQRRFYQGKENYIVVHSDSIFRIFAK